MSHVPETHRTRMRHVTRHGLMSHMEEVCGSAWLCVIKDVLCGSVFGGVALDLPSDSSHVTYTRVASDLHESCHT